MADAAAAVTEHHSATGIESRKLGMWVFLSSESLFFGALISTYLLYKDRVVAGVGPNEVYDIPFTSVSSFVLLMSSLTMVLAHSAHGRRDQNGARIWLLATALLGMTFIGGQVFEFTTFVQEGVKLTENVAASAFFVLTGFHGMHVVGGIFLLLTLFGISLRQGLAEHQGLNVELVGLYWHFVDVVWIIIFTVVYLIP
ncbi:MAG: cytochrome c oxidase subunit 3 [Actinomycetota bacterium]|nr:cytochrome c oxidase subunit 3 [Actinomycetota bacterium]